MKAFVRKVLMYVILILVLVIVVYGLFNFAGYGQINFYSFVFSKTVDGVVENVEKVSPGMAIVGGGPASNKDLFSFALGIKAKDGEIITGTSEDRQWAIVKVGQCAVAKFYPYPPWDLDKSGTYYNVRLIKLYECTTGSPTLTTPAPEAAAPAAVPQGQAGTSVLQAPVPAPSP
jgi:hypothetical protein